MGGTPCVSGLLTCRRPMPSIAHLVIGRANGCVTNHLHAFFVKLLDWSVWCYNNLGKIKALGGESPNAFRVIRMVHFGRQALGSFVSKFANLMLPYPMYTCQTSDPRALALLRTDERLAGHVRLCAFIFARKKIPPAANWWRALQSISIKRMNKMLTQKQLTRNPQSFDAVTISQFLRINPLPPELRYLEKSIRKFPLAHEFLTLVVACTIADFSKEQIDNAITAAGDFYAQSKHRCGACYHWTDHGNAFFLVFPDGTWLTGACCPKCRNLIEQGDSNLERKFWKYVAEDAE